MCDAAATTATDVSEREKQKFGKSVFGYTSSADGGGVKETSDSCSNGPCLRADSSISYQFGLRCARSHLKSTTVFQFLAFCKFASW